MARASTRTVNRGESVATSADRARAHYAAPSLRADATDAPERAAVKRPGSTAPVGSIADLEVVLGF